MAQTVVAEAEALLDKEYPVLDKGFVRLVDYLGSDQRIVQAARVSYGEGTKSYRQDRGLIDYLLRNEHTSPFEQVVLTFHTKMPIFVARQWVRHRTARLNEISGRYSVMKDEFYVPDGPHISFQSEDNKQGRSEEAVDPAVQTEIQESLATQQGAAYAAYMDLVNRGLARELARINLPLAMYTEWYWQIDLHNLFHFLRLRMDAHAQYEIRVYAQTMFEIAKTVAPMACQSFSDHLLGGVRFSAVELEALRSLLGDSARDSQALAQGLERAGLALKDRDRLVTKIVEGRQN